MLPHLGFYVSARDLNSDPCEYLMNWTISELLSNPFGHFSQCLDASNSQWCHTAWLLSSFMMVGYGIMWMMEYSELSFLWLPPWAPLPGSLKPPAEGRGRMEMKFILELVRSTDERFAGIVETSLFTFPYSFKETLLFISEIYMVTREHMCALDVCLK